MPARRPLAIRFWEKVCKQGGARHGCWSWCGFRCGFGYGQIGIRRNGVPWSVSAHRVSYLLNVGDIPAGICVLHRCDNPQCTNPKHLFLGTKADNMRDCVRKGRTAAQLRPEKMPRGESHGMVVLAESDVRRIRALYASGTTQVALAKKYRVGQPHISAIVLRKAWRHVA